MKESRPNFFYPCNMGLVLERFIRTEDDYKEEFYVVWLPLNELIHSMPVIAIFSKEELIFHD